MPYPVFQAGMRVRAHHLRALQWTEVFQVSDRVINSLTGMQNTDLQVPAVAGARYRFVVLASTSSPVDLRFNWETPDSSAADRFLIGASDAIGGGAGSGSMPEVAFRVVPAGTEVRSAGATNVHYREEGDLIAGTSGTFIFQFAQWTSDANDTRFNAGSRLWYIRTE